MNDYELAWRIVMWRKNSAKSFHTCLPTWEVMLLLTLERLHSIPHKGDVPYHHADEARSGLDEVQCRSLQS